MFQTQNIMRRIFNGHKIPQNLSSDEYDNYLQQNFPKWMKQFQDSGYLQQTKLPVISSQEQFLQKLQQHKHDLMIIKFWKHGCIPCLSLAEMYKNACQQCKKEGKKVYWYGVDTKAKSTQQLIDYQLIVGTPTVQTFANEKQVGQQIRATNIKDLMLEINSRMPTN